VTVSAPGKLMLLGEYAVVDGGLAVVAAVNRRAVGVTLTEPDPRPSPVVQAVLTRAARAGAVLPPGVRIDTSAFHDAQGAKLGLGSSAAVAVITAALAHRAGRRRGPPDRGGGPPGRGGGQGERGGRGGLLLGRRGGHPRPARPGGAAAPADPGGSS
jgi:phosphomevalonate kinase